MYLHMNVFVCMHIYVLIFIFVMGHRTRPITGLWRPCKQEIYKALRTTVFAKVAVVGIVEEVVDAGALCAGLFVTLAISRLYFLGKLKSVAVLQALWALSGICVGTVVLLGVPLVVLHAPLAEGLPGDLAVTRCCWSCWGYVRVYIYIYMY